MISLIWWIFLEYQEYISKLKDEVKPLRISRFNAILFGYMSNGAIKSNWDAIFPFEHRLMRR